MITSGWGCYPKIDAEIYSARKKEDIATFLQKHVCIARGLGRSYGDSALYPHIFSSERLNCFLAFDTHTGLLTCESGVTVHDIVQTFVPRGWFLGVTPGTKWVTVGGAIASDVHGKNHHQVGCFSEFVHNIELMLPNGDVITCNRENNPTIFHATCGGMGLTGIILSAQLQLIPIKSAYINQTIYKANHLEEVFDLFAEHANTSYSVAWIDCTKPQGRSILFLGEHGKDPSLPLTINKTSNVPFTFPSWMLNQYSVRWFNHCYYHYKRNHSQQTISLIDYFYPLDAIPHWNLWYGKNGFLQYQCVIPEKDATVAYQKILQKIVAYRGGSFLSVLKLLGPENNNYLSFPLKGYTLALDFKYHDTLFPFLDRLDHIVQHYGGRVYLTKDARMSREFFSSTYPKLAAFREVRRKIEAAFHINSLQSLRLGLNR